MNDNAGKIVELPRKVVDENIGNKEYNISMEKVNESMRGEIDMSKYVSKAEFDSTVKNLENQIAHNQEMTNVKIDSVLEKIDSSNALIIEKINNVEKNLPNQIKLALNEKETSDRQERKETNRFLIGTIVIGGLSLITSIVSFFFNS